MEDGKSPFRRAASSNTVNSSAVPQAKRVKIVRDADPLLTAHIKCKDLWTALQMADYKKEGILNDAAVSVMFEKEKEKFCELLLVGTSEELQQLLDENEDGFLNEDEQLLMFSIVKERMQTAAEDLCAVHEYEKYKEMMKAIRALEGDIVSYQEILRKRTHDKELTAYRELGEEKLHKFQEDWKRRFELFTEENQAQLKAVKARQAQEMFQLANLMKREDTIRVKPKAKLKNLMVEERLVAINERFNEAQKIRAELKALEVEEQHRIDVLVQSDHEKRRRQLHQSHLRELRQEEQKSEAAYNALKIRMKQQYSRLQKEIKLYLNDITKNQNLARRLAKKLGETRDELRRTKKKAKEMMEVMSEAKVVSRGRTRSRHTDSMGSLGSVLGSVTSLPQIPTGRAASGFGGSASVRTSITNVHSMTSPLRQTLKSVTKFSISADVPSTERPINTGGMLLKPSSSRSKVMTELISKHTAKSVIKSLGKLYSDALEPLEVGEDGEPA